MHEHRIRCEICGKTTLKGIIEKDNALRDRYFCSQKCLDDKIDRQEKEREEINEPWAIVKFWRRTLRRFA